MGDTFEARCKAIREHPKARALAWKAGVLWWLLHHVQFEMYQRFHAMPASSEAVWDCARRLGKTYLLIVLAVEACLRKPGAQVKFAAQTAKDVRNTIKPLLGEILSTCPKELRPRSQWHLGELAFPNGSTITIAGCDNGHYDHLRGQRADLWIVDEAGFIAEMEVVVGSILSPQTWTTGGRGIIASTPPDTIGHPFQRRYLAAKAIGAAAHFTFADNPMLSAERKAEIVLAEARKRRISVEEFQKSTVYLREFCAEFVTEESRAVFPVFTEALARRLVRTQEATPLFADRYTVVDLGGTRDPTGIQVAYWDFPRSKYVIRADRILQRPTTEQIANACREMETQAFGAGSRTDGEHFRIADDPFGIVSRDLAMKHGLSFAPPEKDNKQAAAMDVCDGMLREELEFHPDAANSVAHCQAAIWNKRHSEFERVDGFGHFELADTTLYGHRNMLKNKGRIPANWGFNADTMHRRNPPEDEMAALRRAFGG